MDRTGVVARAMALRAMVRRFDGGERLLAVVTHAILTRTSGELPPPASLIRAWLEGDLPMPHRGGLASRRHQRATGTES